MEVRLSTEKEKEKVQDKKPRQSKREQLRAERRRRSTVWNVILLGGGVVVIAIVIWNMMANARPGPLPGEQAIASEGQGHVSSTAGVELTFLHYPPSSGTHYGDQVAAWGFYPEPVPEGTFVHNLEHGGVVFLYKCDTPCADLEQQFADFYESAPPAPSFTTRKVLITPYNPADPAKMPAPIVALAWEHQLNLQQFDADLMLKWYKRFVNRGPEVVQ